MCLCPRPFPLEEPCDGGGSGSGSGREGGLRDERKEQEDEEVVGQKVGVDGVQ